MRVIENTLEVRIDRWEDPGDYPSGAGPCRLPSGEWEVVAVEGRALVQLDWDEAMGFLSLAGEDDLVNEWAGKLFGELLPSGPAYCVVDWVVAHLGAGLVSVEVAEVEPAPEPVRFCRDGFAMVWPPAGGSTPAPSGPLTPSRRRAQDSGWKP